MPLSNHSFYVLGFIRHEAEGEVEGVAATSHKVFSLLNGGNNLHPQQIVSGWLDNDSWPDKETRSMSRYQSLTCGSSMWSINDWFADPQLQRDRDLGLLPPFGNGQHQDSGSYPATSFLRFWRCGRDCPRNLTSFIFSLFISATSQQFQHSISLITAVSWRIKRWKVEVFKDRILTSSSTTSNKEDMVEELEV